ncbi:phosphoribosyltransferase family protein [Flavobacteriales bacterium]|jgi:pyrimidine operon attenuation protein/uracil phosphoribosyltransferase|nr:phosphoribosyltransferase family protein [Flavobacteriales bacterium]
MKSIILNSQQINDKIKRIAFQIIEHNFEEKSIVMLGISGQGFELAKRLKSILTTESDIEVLLEELIVDKKNPYNSEVELSLENKELENKSILLIDDVLNSGKTMMFGLNRVLNIPVKRIASVVLVNRAHKRFPIEADFVGTSLATTLQDHIHVSLNANEEIAYLE